ncbi:hypothetical protein [Croceicoccus mobilis]|uniref:Uncharacterized protein n=1 Tax=Croceicoccus mobilis TaxID=1703339 RepID=A0A916Z3B4_9SPHN|nr:hypothetical protein [Croceicoccus mobilis]GGD74074.1 hypothetical protein GCM10010990_24640 [Croceicoccus mobilis]
MLNLPISHADAAIVLAMLAFALGLPAGAGAIVQRREWRRRERAAARRARRSRRS